MAKQVVIHLEGGMIQAAKLPKGIRLVVLDFDEPVEGHPCYCVSCKWSKRPHDHREQWRSDKWDVQEHII